LSHRFSVLGSLENTAQHGSPSGDAFFIVQKQKTI